MAELTFIYNQIPTIVQCSEKDLFKVAVDKFANKVHVNPSNLYFLYNGTIKIDLNQKIEVIFHNEIQNKTKIQILTYLTEEENRKNNFNISKDIICPKCNLPCLIEIKDYKMTFSRCKNAHTEKEVLISNFKNSQKVDESKKIFVLYANHRIMKNMILLNLTNIIMFALIIMKNLILFAKNVKLIYVWNVSLSIKIKKI